MEAFNKYILQQEYHKLAKLGDRLAKADQLLIWLSAIRHLSFAPALPSTRRVLSTRDGACLFSLSLAGASSVARGSKLR